MRLKYYARLIHSAYVLLQAAEKAYHRGDKERYVYILNDCVEFLTNGLKKKGDLRKKRPA